MPTVMHASLGFFVNAGASLMVYLVGVAQQQTRGTITDQALKRLSCRAIPEEFLLAINLIT